MEKRKIIQRTIYAMIAVDAALLVLFFTIFLWRPSSLLILAAVFLPAILIFNTLFLRRKMSSLGPASNNEGAKPRPRRFSLFACSVIFFVGTLGGLTQILHGELPLTILPFLVIPLSVAVFCLKVARRSDSKVHVEKKGAGS